MSREMNRESSGPRPDEEIGIRADRDRTASRVLLTGATGFVGMEVLARLLEETDHEVVCVVRGDAEARLDQVLATLYSDGTPHRDRVTAVPGDLTGDVASPGPVDVVCHCAASISFDLPLEEARTINVEGTRTMLRVARENGARRFVHVSTAYVSGTHAGLFTEDMLGTEFRNTYEQTKCEAERIVAAEQDGMDVAIARPSIVVGESTTGWTPAFNVLYWPLRAFARGLFDRIPARPDGLVDVVPVDYVADGIAALVDSDATGTFNLVAADEAASVDELATLACAHFGRERPPYVETGASSGAAVDEHGAVYVPYFDMEVVFDDTRTRDVLGIRAPKLSSYFDTLLDYADRAKWGKRSTPRDAAALVALG
jgi:long-chain acyl-CoA synthetase